MTPTVSTRRHPRHPRRRRHFLRLTPARIRALVEPVLGAAAAEAEVAQPAQGVNNETYLVRSGARGLVVRIRPRPFTAARSSGQWPSYMRRLLGDEPNGDLLTLEPATALLVEHGSVPVPDVHLVDATLDVVPAAYAVVELLEGQTFDFDAHRPGPAAARQLGDHLGRVHAATRGGGFGIFARRDAFGLEQWWPRFAAMYRTLARELAAVSPEVADARPELEAVLEAAVGTGTPRASALICHDQNPTHYVAATDGGIAAMLDVEAHLWAPPEYELAMVELWIDDFAALRAAYERRAPWPSAFELVRGAYALATWMEWAYCLYTLLHDAHAAAALEARLRPLARSYAAAAG